MFSNKFCQPIMTLEPESFKLMFHSLSWLGCDQDYVLNFKLSNSCTGHTKLVYFDLGSCSELLIFSHSIEQISLSVC